MRVKRSIVMGLMLLLIMSLMGVMVDAESQNTRSFPNAPEKHIVINEVCDNPPTMGGPWFEIYNPTDISFNTSGWVVWFASIYCPVEMPTIVIHPHEYVIVTWNKNKESVINYWHIDASVKVIGLSGWGSQWDRFSITKGEWNTTYYDGVGEPGGEFAPRHIPSLPLNHSWARYRGGYDTDNFTNDFYDEPNPTPGYENHRSKEGGENNGNEIYWILGIGIGVGAIVAVAGIYYPHKKR